MTSRPEGEGLRKVLNTDGYGFQYAVLKRADQLFSERLSLWRLEPTEFPVVTGNKTIHLDFLLRHHQTQTYLIAECKRADPARAHWCFVRAPYTRRNPRRGELSFDQVQCQPPNEVIQHPCELFTDQGPYHYGFALRTENPGDGRGPTTSAIDDAITQVLRGTSGLSNHLFTRQPVTTEGKTTFLPVIFTTAELWVTDTDLS
jgi:hypothetical protein